MPLTDGVTTNIWTLSTATGQWRQVTDFGDRPTFIARRVSWSVDGRSILAAVGEGDADIVVFEAGDGSIRRGQAVSERRHREGPSMSLLSLQRLTVRLRKCASVPTSSHSAMAPLPFAPDFRSLTMSVGCGWSWT